MPIRVIVADDNLFVREGLERLVEADPRLRLVAACGDLEQLERTIERERPDLVLTDIRMPPTMTDEGIRLALRLRATGSPVAVIVLSQYADPSMALTLLEGGSDGRGYLLKESVRGREELWRAISAVSEGGSVVDPRIVELVVSRRLHGDESPLASLTTREREVLVEIARGKSNAAIADSMVLTKRAVEKYINSIFLKLDLGEAEDVSKRVKAALLFLTESRPVDS